MEYNVDYPATPLSLLLCGEEKGNDERGMMSRCIGLEQQKTKNYKLKKLDE